MVWKEGCGEMQHLPNFCAVKLREWEQLGRLGVGVVGDSGGWGEGKRVVLMGYECAG